MTHVAFQTHEVPGNRINTAHGHHPYFAIGKLVQATGGAGEFDIEIQGEESTGAREWTLEVDGEQWVVHLAYQQSGLESMSTGTFGPSTSPSGIRSRTYRHSRATCVTDAST